MPENPQTTILLIRHTDVYNPQDILYGRLPRFRLSELGVEQAENTARSLEDVPIDVFYSSPRLRARQTARIIADRHPGVPVRTTRLLDEVLTGWQGRPHSELEEHGFNFYHHRLHPADETLEDLWARIERFFALMRKRHSGETVAAVSHGDPVMLARAAYSGQPVDLASLRLPYIYIGKGSITRFTFSSDRQKTYPLSVEYYDPNSHGEPWSEGFVTLEENRGLVASR